MAPIDPTAKAPPPGYLALGLLGRTFQLEGALRWRLPVPLTADPAEDDLLERAVRAGKSVYVRGLGEVHVRALRFNAAAGTLLLLEGVRDRTAAQRLVNAEVWIDPEKLPPSIAAELAAAVATPSEEETLIGLPVLLDGVPVGSVIDADLGGPNAIAVVELIAGGSALVPLAAPYVTLEENGAIELRDPPAGLLGSE